MTPITNFKQLGTLFASMTDKKRVAVVCPEDEETIAAIEKCIRLSLARFVLVFSSQSAFAQRMMESADEAVSVIMADEADEAARIAVAEVREHRADVIMKGTINTDNLLHAVLNKQTGILEPGRVLTHLTAAELPDYPKLLFFSDAAVIPEPELYQMRAMIGYDVDLLHRLHLQHPKVALIHFSEKTNARFPHTIFYEQLKREAAEGAFGPDVTVDGPMDAKTACDLHSAEIKHIESPMAGRADLLIFPNLVAANTFYKSISFFGHALMAGILFGARVPIVIPSRADSATSKFYSLALACIAHS